MKFLAPGDRYALSQTTPADYSIEVAYGSEPADLTGAKALYAWNAGGEFSSSPAVRHPGWNGDFLSVAQRSAFTAQDIRGAHREEAGRLRYIDGCSDSLLIYAPKLGDPCLNYLYFPPNIRQTMHTHPTVRVGLVVGGKGRAIWFEDGQPRETPLLPGMAFILEPDERHCFYTDDSTLKIFAYHPDSDTGPTDEDHPMKNRTIIGGA